ncbi:MAG: hypothetical protein EBQ96_02205 [Proteobacteria bacterium]|nr:hypothetical protein [Pseudomonadota bacterium]
MVLLTGVTLVLAACSGGADEDLARDLAAPERVDVLAPPRSPDPDAMHPALQIARSRGLKTNVYFNEELQQAVARLHGMEETLGRLQSDLQGTAMAMQRVEMMRQEVEGLNLKIQSLQERLLYAGPALEQAEMRRTMDAQPEPVTAEAPTPLMGDMAKPAEPADTANGQISKPVMDEAPAKVAPQKSGSGVVGVRVGAHSDSVRIVLDVMGGKDKFTANLDNAEKVLMVELPDTSWSGAKTETLKGNPLVASYTAQPSGKGTVLAVALKGETKILGSKTLKGAAGKPTRLIIDLSK